MSEEAAAKGAITRAELEELAALFDAFENAFDPLARSAKEAEVQFVSKVRRLFDERVAAAYPEVECEEFKVHVVTWCRYFLRDRPKRRRRE